MANRSKKPKPRKITEYEMPDLKISDGKLVLGADPGSKNFGIALVGLVKGRVKVYANSVLMQPVDDLKIFNQKSSAFIHELDTWMQFAPDGIVAERFQTRGNSGPLIEYVSSMLGLIKGIYWDTPIKLTIASAWKNRVQRRFGIDLKEIYPQIGVQPHQLDAALIGVFGLEEGTTSQINYTLEDVIRQVEATSLIGLRNRRNIK
jgi:hypothetical protein